jgi:hypothetical protein
MPIVIHEVVVEVLDGPIEPGEAEPLAGQFPVPASELSAMQTLTLIQQRQERLKVD